MKEWWERKKRRKKKLKYQKIDAELNTSEDCKIEKERRIEEKKGKKEEKMKLKRNY